MCVNSVLYFSYSFIRTHISVKVDDINEETIMSHAAGVQFQNQTKQLEPGAVV